MWDDGAMFWGMILGVFLGAVAALLHLPESILRLRSNLEQLPGEMRSTLQPKDSVQERLEDEKAAAWRRRQEIMSQRS